MKLAGPIPTPRVVVQNWEEYFWCGDFSLGVKGPSPILSSQTQNTSAGRRDSHNI